MKLILMASLCLLMGCQTDVKSNAPVACPLSMTVANNRLEIYPQNINTRYQYYTDNKLVWDDCTSSSDFALYSVGIFPNYGGSTAYKKIFEGYISTLSQRQVRLRIHELDSMCQPQAPVVDAILDVTEDVNSAGEGSCSYSYSTYSLRIGI